MEHLVQKDRGGGASIDVRRDEMDRTICRGHPLDRASRVFGARKIVRRVVDHDLPSVHHSLERHTQLSTTMLYNRGAMEQTSRVAKLRVEARNTRRTKPGNTLS